MFDLGFTELFLIGVVALIVLGPERLPKAARTVGVLLRRARNTYVNLKSDIERELAAEELKRSLKAVNEPAEEVKQAFEAARKGGRDFQASLMQSDREHASSEIDSALGTSESSDQPLESQAAPASGKDHGDGQTEAPEPAIDRRTGDIGKRRPSTETSPDSDEPSESSR